MLIDRGEELGLFFPEKSSKVSAKEQMDEYSATANSLTASLC